jgi:hypothetical protein
MWIVLALGTAVLTSLNPIIDKRLLVAAEVPVVIWTAQLIALPLLATFALAIFGVSTVDQLFIVLVVIVALLNAAAHIDRPTRSATVTRRSLRRCSHSARP